MVIKIEPDNYPESPREWDNLGTIIHWHKRYNLGDISVNREEIAEYLKDSVYLPVYLYDHSGITISTGRFSCPWDSGLVGFIFVKREKILENYGKKRLTKSLRKRVLEILEGEIEIFDQYLTGDVYGYIIEGDGIDESCWGFYGVEDCKAEALSMANYLLRKKLLAHLSKVKTWIKNKVPLYARKSYSPEDIIVKEP